MGKCLLKDVYLYDLTFVDNLTSTKEITTVILHSSNEHIFI